MMNSMMKRNILKPLLILLCFAGAFALEAQDTLVVSGVVKAGRGFCEQHGVYEQIAPALYQVSGAPGETTAALAGRVCPV